jgi:antirestriction protein ArdC
MVRRSRCTRETVMDGEVLSKPRFDVHQSITEKILVAVESGAGEFRMPWHSKLSAPRNTLTGKSYRGVNIVALWAEAMLRGFDSACWATYRQWRELGAQVRRGERGSAIVFYKKVEDEGAHTDDEEDGAPRERLIARASWVFNASQVEGWSSPEPPQRNLVETLETSEAFVRATGADIRERGNRAYYSPSEDFIQVPPRSAFVGTETSTPTEGFYATLFHELTHWSGHPTRLDRDLSGRFGGRAYAAEELVAELGAAFLCADLGVTNVPRPDHAQYVGSWHTLLRFDRRAIFTAASKASAAAEYLAVFRTAKAVLPNP